jgi:flagellar hook assembly protein FlgD
MRTVSLSGGDTAVYADFNVNQSLIAVTTAKGKVEIRKENGTLIRTINLNSGSIAINARWNGSDLAITTNKGKTEIRKENGL